MKLKAVGISFSYTGNSTLIAACVVLLWVAVVFFLLPCLVIWAVATLVHAPLVLSWSTWGAALFVLFAFAQPSD